MSGAGRLPPNDQLAHNYYRKVPAPSGTAIVRELDFTPMDAFMAHVLESFRQDATTAVRVFPAGARVVLSFADHVTMDVIGEYINTLLGQTRIMSPELSLRASAASFVQAWKMVDVAMEVLGEKQTEIPHARIEQLVYTMFEPHMDEYLDDETEWVKGVLDGICNAWDAELGTDTKGAGRHHAGHHSTGPQFLSSQNPDQVKRNVLAGFRDVLLLPVTIVPRTVTFAGKAIVSGSTQAVAGLSMLNPQKWAMGTTTDKGTPGKMVNGEVVFDVPVAEPEDEKEEQRDEVDELTDAVDTLQVPGAANGGGASGSVSGATTPDISTAAGSGAATPAAGADGFANLQLLVSLDTALELIHGDRDALKRAETFAKYPGKCGSKVVDCIEEIFILALKAIGDRHIAPGFKMCVN